MLEQKRDEYLSKYRKLAVLAVRVKLIKDKYQKALKAKHEEAEQTYNNEKKDREVFFVNEAYQQYDRDMDGASSKCSLDSELESLHKQALAKAEETLEVSLSGFNKASLLALAPLNRQAILQSQLENQWANSLNDELTQRADNSYAPILKVVQDRMEREAKKKAIAQALAAEQARLRKAKEDASHEYNQSMQGADQSQSEADVESRHKVACKKAEQVWNNSSAACRNKHLLQGEHEDKCLEDLISLLSQELKKHNAEAYTPIRRSVFDRMERDRRAAIAAAAAKEARDKAVALALADEQERLHQAKEEARRVYDQEMEGAMELYQMNSSLVNSVLDGVQRSMSGNLQLPDHHHEVSTQHQVACDRMQQVWKKNSSASERKDGGNLLRGQFEDKSLKDLISSLDQELKQHAEAEYARFSELVRLEQIKQREIAEIQAKIDTCVAERTTYQRNATEAFEKAQVRPSTLWQLD